MPIPNPKKNQKRWQYMDSCMHFLKHEAKNKRPQPQRVAICLGRWGKKTNEMVDVIVDKINFLLNEKECPEGQHY